MTGGSEGAVLSPLLPLPSCRQPAGLHLPRHAGLSLVSLSCRLPVPWVSLSLSFVSVPRCPCVPLAVPVSGGLCRPPLPTPGHSLPPGSSPPLVSPVSHLSLCLLSPSRSMLLSPSVSLSSSSLSVSPSSVWESPLLCFRLLSPPVSASSISSLIWKKLSLHWPLCFPTPRGWTLQTPVRTLSDARGSPPCPARSEECLSLPELPPSQVPGCFHPRTLPGEGTSVTNGTRVPRSEGGPEGWEGRQSFWWQESWEAQS